MRDSVILVFANKQDLPQGKNSHIFCCRYYFSMYSDQQCPERKFLPKNSNPGEKPE